MTKYLIVNSDDFGISAGVSRGIIEAHRQGIVTSTTTMVNMPYAETAIREAQHSAPNMGLGLHFTLSYGEPVSSSEAVPSLVTEAGIFVSTLDDLLAKIVTFNAEDLSRELRAQFDRFVAIAGYLPTHLDSHHGCTYHHPMAFDVMIQIAMEYGLPIRWVGELDVRYNPSSDNHDLMQAQADSFTRHGQPKQPDHFADCIFDFDSTSRVERLKTGLQQLQAGITEMMVHVGYGTDLDEPYNFQRDEELEAVTDAGVVQMIEELDIQLVNFDSLSSIHR